MPAAIVVECSSTTGRIQKEYIQGRGLHGAFFDAVKRVSPELADELHQGSFDKPFTLGLPGRWCDSLPPQRFQFRITLLQELLFPLMYRLAEATRSAPLCVGPNQFQIQTVHVGSGNLHAWSGIASWSQLLEQASTQRSFSLQFETPTSFRKASQERKIKMELPYPLPSLVLGSALKRWERWSELPLDSIALREIFEEHIEVIAPFSLHSREVIMHFQESESPITRTFSGVVGHASYQIRGDVPPLLLQQTNALVDALFYTGAGHKTTMGMGMLRRCYLEPQQNTNGRRKKNRHP